MTYLDPAQTTEVDAVVGACMLIRGELLAQVGLLDEQFFMYAEDLDWCKRIKEAVNPRTGRHWQVWYDAAVQVLHVKRASSSRSARAQRAFNETMLQFYRKHYAHSTPFWLDWLVVGGIEPDVALPDRPPAGVGQEDTIIEAGLKVLRGQAPPRKP